MFFFDLLKNQSFSPAVCLVSQLAAISAQFNLASHQYELSMHILKDMQDKKFKIFPKTLA